MSESHLRCYVFYTQGRKIKATSALKKSEVNTFLSLISQPVERRVADKNRLLAAMSECRDVHRLLWNAEIEVEQATPETGIVVEQLNRITVATAFLFCMMAEDPRQRGFELIRSALESFRDFGTPLQLFPFNEADEKIVVSN